MSNNTNLSNLLNEAGLDADASAAMALTADTLGPAIMAGLGEVSLDDISSSEVVLVTLLLDDSGSIRFVAGNTEAVRTGHNTVLDALSGTKQSSDVLISCRYLNDDPPTNQGVLYPYRPLSGAPRLDSNNYDPRGGTPLYDQVAVTLTGVAAKMAEFEVGGVAARAITAIITDGDDQHSYTHRTARSVRPIIEGLLKTEQHIIVAMGIDDGQTLFRDVFQEMGVVNDWILTPGNTPSEIRKAFTLVSQSAVRASQSAGSFSQTALGGFGNP
jgi:hypothetical protein